MADVRLGDEVSGFGADARIPDRHEVRDEVVAAEKLEVAEPIALPRRPQECLDEAALELGRDLAGFTYIAFFTIYHRIQ